MSKERAHEERGVTAQRQARLTALALAAGISAADLSPLGRAALEEMAGCGGRWYDGYVELLTVVRGTHRDVSEPPDGLSYPNPGPTTTKPRPPAW